MPTRLCTLIALSVMTGLLTTAASAAPKLTQSGPLLTTRTASDTEPRFLSALAPTGFRNFQSLPLVVPAGQTRLVTARFTAESQCGGPQSGWCSINLIAKKRGTTTIVPLDPASGADFAFDANQSGTDEDLYEGHSVERSVRLPEGSWDVFVQWALVNNGAYMYFRIDDWHFRIEVAQ